MSKLTPLINSFNTGEVNPELNTRVDLDKYNAACRTLQNMVPLVEGGAKRMPGTYYVVTAKNAPDYLIGWYKFDEGIGATVINYATNGVLGGGLLPDLTVIGDLATFWNTVSGFGYSLWGIDEENFCYAYISGLNRIFGPLYSFGCFFKRIETYESCYLLTILDSLYEITIQPTGYANYIHIDYEDIYAGATYWNSTIFIDVVSMLDKWYFVFLDENCKINLVREDGTLITETSNAGSLNPNSKQIDSINLGIDDWYEPGEGLGGPMGDILIYNNKRVPISTPGDGYKSWSQWYDELRSRYGMAARSGW